MNNRKILLVNVETDKLKQIQALSGEFGIDVVVIKPPQFGEKIGALAGLPGMELSNNHFFGKAFKDEVLIFVGISSDNLDEILKRYRESNIKPIPLKAVLTPHNAQWNLVQLQQELIREHLEFANRNKR